MAVVGAATTVHRRQYQSRQKFLNGRQAPSGAETSERLAERSLRAPTHLPRQRAERHPFADKLDPEQHTQQPDCCRVVRLAKRYKDSSIPTIPLAKTPAPVWKRLRGRQKATNP